jgi:hypothetical protein
LGVSVSFISLSNSVIVWLIVLIDLVMYAAAGVGGITAQ